MTDELKQWFIDGHNKLRNQHALGQTGGLFTDTVSNMASLVSGIIKTVKFDFHCLDNVVFMV